MKTKTKKTLIYSAVALTLMLLFWNPLTRQLILWILPLGSGMDDIVFIVLLVIGLTIATVRVIKFHGEVIWEQVMRLNFGWIILGIVVFLFFACLFLQIYPIY